MSTRSLIAHQTPNGFEAIYCHQDGHPRVRCPILIGSYATAEAVEALLDLGDLSILGPQLGRAHDFHTHIDNPDAQDWCLAYGRDRGDSQTHKRSYATEADLLADARNRWAAYVYLFRDGRWFYCEAANDPEWIVLARKS